MHSVRTGSGKPLLLVHGISNLHNWDLVVPALARERTVIAIDLPGFGESPPLTGEVSVASLTDAVENFIAEQDLGGVDVVGSSMGARMVLDLARRGHAGDVVWSDWQVKIFGATVGPSIALVKRIQPLLPAMTKSAVGRTALLLQFSAKPWRLPADLVLGELRNFNSSPSLNDAVRALVHGPKQQGAPAGSLEGRVTIGWGRNDRVTLPSEAGTAMRAFPDASLHWFSNCGHFPHWDRPEETVRLILGATG
jgi:pimeloyl-ACP methyl ester carboxylesterase